MAIIGKIRQNFRGQWTTSTAYKIRDVVRFKNGYYECIAAHTSNASATTATATGYPFNVPAVSNDRDTLLHASTYWKIIRPSIDANKGGNGYLAAISDTNDIATKAWWTAGTYYPGDIVVHHNTTTKKVGVYYWGSTGTTTTSPSTSSSWIQIATHRGSATYTAGEACESPFPNDGYHIPSDWAAQTYTPGDALGYHVSQAASAGRSAFKNGWGGLTILAGPAVGTQNYSFPFESAVQTHSTEVPFRCLDWQDGSLPTTDGNAPYVVQTLMSYTSMLVLLSNGEVHYGGYNGHGQAGNGDAILVAGTMLRCGYSNQGRTGATTALRGKKAIRIALTVGANTSSSANSCYALVDNLNGTTTLYSWGYNAYGQLGQGNTTNLSVPTAVPFNTATYGQIREIWADGGNYGRLYVLTTTGQMLSCGYDNIGQCGQGVVGNKTSLGLVKNWAAEGGVKKFSAGGNAQYSHYAVVTKNGKLFTWGESGVGQGGLSKTTDTLTPTRVGTATNHQNVWCIGSNANGNMFYTVGTSNTSNTLYACGENANYQLGTNATTDTGAGANTTVKDSFTANLTNIVNVMGDQGNGNTITVNIEKYISAADTNSSGWVTEWYLGGRRDGGSFTGVGNSTNIYNYDYFNIPCATDAADRYRYHANIRTPVGLNPRRTYIMPCGINVFDQCTLIDRDTGQVFVTGNLPNISPAEAPNAAIATPNIGWTPQTLPFA